MDDTLYPMSLGLNLACRKNIEGLTSSTETVITVITGDRFQYINNAVCVILFAEFMLHKLHIEESEIPKMCLELYREYGTTMAGLKVKLYPRLFNSRVLPLLLLLLLSWELINLNTMKTRLLAMSLMTMSFMPSFMEDCLTKHWSLIRC